MKDGLGKSNRIPLVETALEIANKRRDTLLRARIAATREDWKEVDRLLKELVPDEALHEPLKELATDQKSK